MHIENQTLLWNSLQKSPYIVEFQQKYAAHRETWFRGIVEQFYAQWISAGRPVPNSSKDLLEMNKAAIKMMVSDLKRLLGYNATATTTPLTGDNIRLMSYDVAAEKKEREDKWSSEFSQYQSEYNRLLASPVLPRNVLPSETTDERIKNMDELLAEHAKRREYDVSSIAASFPPPPNSMSNAASSQQQGFKNPNRTEKQIIDFGEDSHLGGGPPRLKILDEGRPKVF